MPIVLITLIAFAFAVIQALIAGAKLVYGLPSYAVFAIAAVFAAVVPWKAAAGKPRIVCVVLTVLLAAYICVRSRLSPVDYLARHDFFMTLGALLTYFIAAVHLPRAKERLALMWILLGFAIAHVAVGAVQFKEGDNYMLLPWIFRPDYDGRASGFYICPNHLAGLLEMLGLIALSFCCWGRGKVWVRIVAAYALVMCLAGVAITGSRGGYLSTVGGLIAFTALSLWAVKKLRSRMFVPMCAIAVVVGFLVVGGTFLLMAKSDALKERLDTIYDPTNMRVLLWAAAMKQFALNPAIGTGSGTYLYYGRQFRSEFVQNDPIHVHSDYLELLCEYGIAGAALCFVFLAAHITSGILGLREIALRKLKPAWRAQSNELALIIGGLSATAALMVHSVIDFNLHIPANTLFVAFIFGMFASPTVVESRAAPSVKPRRGWLRFVAPTTGVLVLVLTVQKMPAEYHGELARIALRDRHYAAARDHAARALAHEKKNPDLFYYFGEAQHYLSLESKDPGEAVRLNNIAASAFADGLAIFPQDLRLLLKLGRTLDNLGRFDEADPYFRRAIAADPKFGNVYAYYGVHWHLQRRFKKAESLYRKAQRLGEKEVSAAGLRDLERDRRLAAEDVFADLVSDPEMEEDDEEFTK